MSSSFQTTGIVQTEKGLSYLSEDSKSILENFHGWVSTKYGLENGLRKTVLWYLKNYDWCQNIFKKGNYRLERLGK